LKQSLTRQHEIQIVIRLHVECLQHLIQHFAVLRGDAHSHIELAGLFAQFANHRAELNGLRPGTENQKDLVHKGTLLNGRTP